MKNLGTLYTNNQMTNATKNIEIKYESFAERKLKEVHKDLNAVSNIDNNGEW